MILSTAHTTWAAATVLGASAARLTYLATVDPIEVGGKLGQMTGSMVLGVVCVALVCALVRVFALKEKATAADLARRDQYLSDHAALVKDTATAAQRAADMGVQVSGLLVEVKDALRDNQEASRAVVKAVQQCEFAQHARK